MPRSKATTAEKTAEKGASAAGLVVEKVNKWAGKRQLLKDVSLQVAPKQIVALLGPNGAGKTTCFHAITGLVPVQKGKVSLQGTDVTAKAVYARARYGLGYLPQEASIFRGLNAQDNIKAVLEIVEKRPARVRERLQELLAEFSLEHVRKSPSVALSGGERRRVEIARALAANPQFMLLDEPFAGVDPIAVGEVQSLVRRLKDRGLGVLITDHNVRETLKLVDYAYILHDGAIIAQGIPAEIAENKQVKKVYLGDDFKLS